jgi:Flp pilus assembly protein TadG
MKNTLVGRLWSDESGVSAVELALVASFIMVPLLLGATELGRHIWTTAKVDSAARTGFVFATVQNTNTNVDNNAINTAIANATSLPVTVHSSKFSGCPTSTGVIPQASGTACTNGGTTGTYWSLTVTTSYLPLFHACRELLPQSVCPLTSSEVTLSSTVVFRVS